MPRNELTTGGAVVSATNPLPTTPGTGVTFDVSDRAARDNGKVDIASIDQAQFDDTDKLAVSLYGKNAAAGDTPVLVDASGNVLVSLATTLDSAYDSIDVDKMSKGSVTTAHNEISGTATSSEMDFRPYNAAHIEVTITGTGNWDIEMTGCAVSGGTFVSQYVGNTQLIRQAMTASAGFIFPAGANYIKIVATENSGTATVTVKVTPLVIPVITETAIDSVVSGSEAQVDIVAEIPAGTQIIGQVGIDQTTPGTTNAVVVNRELRETQVGSDLSNTWAASAVQYTCKYDTVSQPSTPIESYEVTGKNPSLITDITMTLEAVKTSLGGETCYSEICEISLPATTGAVIEDCEDPWDDRTGGNVTCDVDAVNKKVGANSADFVVDAAAGVEKLASETIASTNLSKYTHIRLWILSSIALDAGDLEFYLDDTADCVSPLETIAFPAITAATWTRVDLPLANPASDLAIISVGFGQTVDKGAMTINIDDVRAIKMSVKSDVVSGLFNGGDLRVKQSIDTALGADDSFTSTVRIEEYR